MSEPIYIDTSVQQHKSPHIIYYCLLVSALLLIAVLVIESQVKKSQVSTPIASEDKPIVNVLSSEETQTALYKVDTSAKPTVINEKQTTSALNKTTKAEAIILTPDQLRQTLTK